jgi:hypothetical protein
MPESVGLLLKCPFTGCGALLGMVNIDFLLLQIRKDSQHVLRL